MSDDDFIRAHGRLFIAVRLKRLSDQIIASSADYLVDHGYIAPERSPSTLLLLREHGVLAITEIAARLRLSHPMVIKLASALAKRGLVENESDPADQRRRLIRLTPRGMEEADRLLQFNRLLDSTLEELFDDAGSDLLAVVERFEAALERQSLRDRLERRATP